MSRDKGCNAGESKGARAAVAELRSHGVVFEEYDLPGLKTVEGIADTGGGSAAWFKDTEGNTIGVLQLNS